MAGIAGSGLGQAGGDAGARMAETGGLFSPLARRQYSALAAMRWQGFRNSLRTTRGTVEAVAGGLNSIFYGMLGLGTMAGLGGGAYLMVSKGKMALLPVLFWAVFLTWQTMPLVMASFQPQLDLKDLLRFPIGFESFFLLHVLFGLFDATTLLGSLGSLGIWAGVTAAEPRLLAWAAAALAIFGIFNVLLSRTIFIWLDRWLAKRKTREIVSMAFLVAMLSLQFLNPAVRGDRHHASAATQASEQAHRELLLASAAQRWLPPGLAESAIEDGAGGAPAGALGSLGLMALWTAACALAMGTRLRAAHRGELLGDTPRAAAREKHPRAKTTATPAASFPGSRGPIIAIIEKDLHTVARSLPLIYALGAPLAMVLIFASLMRGEPGRVEFPLALPLCIAYALLGFTQFIYNSLGAEGMGIQMLLYSPTPMRTILLAKNIFHAFLFCAIALLAGVLAILRLGAPAPMWIAITAAWLFFALPAHLAAGNLFSLILPHRLNLGRIGRQRGGRASALLGMLVQAGILGVGAAVAGLCSLAGNLWLAVPILLALAAPAYIGWMRVLAKADSIAMSRRDGLITALAKAE